MFEKYLNQYQAGFTLLEILVALVIFSVGILGVATMQITSIQGNSKGRVISQTTNVTRNHFEDFLTKDYADADLTDTNSDGAAGLNESNTPDHTLTTPDNYVLDWNVAEDYPFDGTKTVRIFSISPDGNSRVSMDYLVSNQGN